MTRLTAVVPLKQRRNIGNLNAHLSESDRAYHKLARWLDPRRPSCAGVTQPSARAGPDMISYVIQFRASGVKLASMEKAAEAGVTEQNVTRPFLL